MIEIRVVVVNTIPSKWCPRCHPGSKSNRKNNKNTHKKKVVYMKMLFNILFKNQIKKTISVYHNNNLIKTFEVRPTFLKKKMFH